MLASMENFLANFIAFPSSTYALKLLLAFISSNACCVDVTGLSIKLLASLWLSSKCPLSMRWLVLVLCRQQYLTCLQKSGINVPFGDLANVFEEFRCTRSELERTATDVDGRSDAELLYFALDERLRPRTLYLGMTYKIKQELRVNC